MAPGRNPGLAGEPGHASTLSPENGNAASPEPARPSGDSGGASFADLLRRAKAGDEAAWVAIFSRLGREEAEGGKLLSIARRILPAGDRLRDLVESRDLLQSALRSGWLDASSFRGSTEGELYAWLRQILRHKLGRVLRRDDPRPGAEDIGDGELPAGEEGDDPEPLAEALRAEVRDRVQAAIARLPEDQRAVMELRLQGLGSPEIGRILSIKPDAVRKRESRAAERLREMLGE